MKSEELKELESLKKLMIIDLVRKGVSQTHIASALDVSPATITGMFPKGLLKAIKT